LAAILTQAADDIAIGIENAERRHIHRRPFLLLPRLAQQGGGLKDG
jgi:hypothetical protein